MVYCLTYSENCVPLHIYLQNLSFQAGYIVKLCCSSHQLMWAGNVGQAQISWLAVIGQLLVSGPYLLLIQLGALFKLHRSAIHFCCFFSLLLYSPPPTQLLLILI